MERTHKASLARFSTLKIGGEADQLCVPATADELLVLMDGLKGNSEPWHILGGGSNILISSKGVPGTVIRLTQLTEILHPEPEVVEAGTGARLPHVARYAASIGLSGLEFAVGIPGTVGGAVVMNAGAHGSAIADVLESVTLFDTTTWNTVTWSAADLGFAYRKSNLNPEIQIVLSARFRLTGDAQDRINNQMRANEEYRWRTQPLGWPSAGSTFTNPEGQLSAGALLDQAGAKGLREGDAAVSAVHANFVINLGEATSGEVTKLLCRMQECVYNDFQVRLKPEWRKLGLFEKWESEIWNGQL